MLRNWCREDANIAGEHENYSRNVAKWIEQGYTRPGLCFVWTEESVIKGGIAFSADDPGSATILDFSLSPDLFHLGAEVLNQSISRLFAQCASYHLYNDNEMYTQYKQCFIDAGFIVAQEKLSFRFTKETPITVPAIVPAGNIVFRSYAEVGEKDFTEAVALVTRNTLDRIDAGYFAKYGHDDFSAAGMMIKDLKEIDFQPDIWVLAYIGDEMIGLVIPSDFGDNLGGINYIGVVPTERGKGYVDILLNKGVQLLKDRGVATIIADVDVLNFPMKEALERNGYDFYYDEVVLERR